MKPLDCQTPKPERHFLLPIFRIFLVLMLAVSVVSALSPAASAQQTVTLSDFLKLVRERHPLFEKERLAAEIEGKERDSFLGAQDWTLSASPGYSHYSDIFGGLNTETVDETTASLAAERAYWNTGGRLSVEWTAGFSRSKFPDLALPFEIDLGPTDFYQNQIALTYSQPLLQNYAGELDRLGYEVSQHAVDMVAVRALENQEDFLVDMGLRFIDWVLLTEQRVIATQRLHLAERQLGISTRRRAAYLVDEVDVLRALDAVRIAEQNVVLIEAQSKAKQAELAVLSRAERLYTQSPHFDLYARTTRPPLHEGLARTRERSRLLRALAIQREQLERRHRGFEELAQPRLSLNTRLARKSGGDRFGEAFDFNKSDASFYLAFSYPLGNRTAMAKVEKSALQIRRLDLEAEQVTLRLEASLRSLLIQIEELERVLSLNEAQMKTARDKTQEENKRYNQGRSDLTFVIQSQDNEERARLTYARNAATYHKMLLRLSALLDDLLPGDRVATGEAGVRRP